MALNDPAGHTVQGAPAVEYDPEGQAVQALANAPETDPCGQGIQDVAPVNEYVEGGQNGQSEPLA